MAGANKKDNLLQISSKCNNMFHVAGLISGIGFSTYVMNPKSFSSIFGSQDKIAANSLWFNAHLGVGMYIYSRQHIQQAPFYRKILYSTFGAVIFNFGSVLFWAASKTVLPKNDSIRTLLGIVSGLTFFMIGRDYLNFVDQNTTRKELVY